jgi:cardiolipin synthase (CMP-forming)
MPEDASKVDHSNDIVTVPNVITMFRILLIPIFVLYFLNDRFVEALTVFALAGLSDGVDGYLARRLDRRTKVGQALDPIADKSLMLSGFLAMAIPSEINVPIPWWMTACVIGRDVIIVSAAALIYGFTGFRDFKPSLPGKLSTFAQVCLIVLYLLAQVAPGIRFLLPFGLGVALTLTIFSGLHYIYFVNAELREYRRSATL